MTAQPRLPRTLVDFIRAAITTNALPGETESFHREQQREAAEFIASAAAVRPPRTTAIKIESTGGEAGRRRMRLVAINEDMPFLVDSVASAIAARDLTIHRLLHPIVNVTRDKQGRIDKLGEGQAESVIYIELDRADSRGRQELVRQLKRVLSDVRAAVTDWRTMLAEMKSDAESLDKRDSESAELLRFLANNNFTFTTRELSTTVELRDGQSFALAGLLQSANRKKQSQLPWIGQVPILGALFRSSSFVKDQTDLVVIVTPHIVSPAVPGEKLATAATSRGCLAASTMARDEE